MSQTEVQLSWRDLNIAYNVDKQSVAVLATHYGIDYSDMKAALRSYGFTIRKNEEKPTTPVKAYTVTLIDTDKIVQETKVAKEPIESPVFN
jgi:hypothetical protein